MRDNIFLRLSSEADYPLIMAWRNIEKISQGFYTQKQPLTWSTEHLKWFQSRPSSWRTFLVILIENDIERPIGVVNIGQLEHFSPEIGYFIGEPTLWGKGYGKEAVRLSINWLIEHGYKYCHTTVKEDNIRSIRLLEALGFEKGMSAREGEVYYQRKI